MALTQMAEQINSKFSAQHQLNQRKPESLTNGVKGNSESVDLDNLFAFLSEVTPNGQNSNSNAIISEIDYSTATSHDSTTAAAAQPPVKMG